MRAKRNDKQCCNKLKTCFLECFGESFLIHLRNFDSYIAIDLRMDHVDWVFSISLNLNFDFMILLEKYKIAVIFMFPYLAMPLY